MFDDKEAWRFINTFAPWFSGLGTLLAVITSLWLALRASRLKLRVFPAIVKIFYEDDIRSESPEFLQIRVVNHGRSAVVAGIGWWRLRGIRTSKKWVILPPGGTFTTRLPKRLEFGEEAAILLPTATFNADAISLLQDITASRFPSLRVRFLRVGVFASTGQQFRVAPDQYVRKFLLERASQIPKS
jgi:hypothetical protein